MQKIVSKLSSRYKNLTFLESSHFLWSPRRQAIYYKKDSLNTNVGTWTLFHELGHALLQHKSYSLDIELLDMENSAWNEAKKIAKDFNVSITEDHIQNCVDSYRNWIHLRSLCPNCNCTCIQNYNNFYTCFNCSKSWQVSSSRLCRHYRLTVVNASANQ